MATSTITRQALDYLPIATRAAEARPDSVILWAEAIRALGTIIDAANTLFEAEADAAHAQYLTNRIADLALHTPTTATATRSEQIKDTIMQAAESGAFLLQRH